MPDVTLLPAIEQARMVRAREIGAVELLEQHLARYERHNGRLNAVIFSQIDRARARAEAADRAIARGDPVGPLHGVVMTIKDSYNWVGAPTTWGDPAMRDNYPASDAVAVERLQQAGAVIYGKTNVPLNLGDWQSFNAIYGTTNNPWDLGRTPGGSSGGAAAALAAGMSSLEIGSDIGASIRNPAHYCGVYGHKPTYGIVPPQGEALPGRHAPADIAVCGPLARSAEDLGLAMDVLAGAAGLDAVGWRLELPPPRHRRLADFRVAALLDSPVCAQDDTLTARLQAVVEALAKAGAKVDDRARPEVDLARQHHVYLLLLRAQTGVYVTDEVYAAHQRAAAAHGDRFDHYRAYLDKGVTLTHRDWWKLHNEREALRQRWAAFFRDYDLLLCPAAASTAFPHDHEGERADRTIPINGKPEPVVDQMFWAGLPSVVYLPATVAPVGLARDGLPCGLQIVGPHLEDRTTIEFARLMADVVGGFQPPPGYA